jgi:hypothetical protein
MQVKKKKKVKHTRVVLGRFGVEVLEGLQVLGVGNEPASTNKKERKKSEHAGVKQNVYQLPRGRVLGPKCIMKKQKCIPVDRGKVLALREFLVEAPKHLHNGQGGGSDGVRKIATRRGDGPDDGDRPFAIRET